MNLVDDDHAAVFGLSELVLRVDQNEAARRAGGLSRRKQTHGDLGGFVEVFGRHLSEREDLFARARDVVLAFGSLRGGREDRRRQVLVLAQSVGQRVTAEVALAPRVVRPDRRRGRAGHVGAHHHLDQQGLALDAREHVRIRRRQKVVGRNLSGRLEPVRGEPVEHLTLEGDRPQHAIEGADAIGDDDQAPPVARVVVANLAFVFFAELAKIRGVERAREGLPERGFVDHLARLLAHLARRVMPRGNRQPKPCSRSCKVRGRNLARVAEWQTQWI